MLLAAGGAVWKFLSPEAPESMQEPKESAVEECNRESEFLVPLTAPASRVVDLPELELTANGFGCDVYGSDGVEYTVSGYPDVLNPYHLTDVWVESGACAVYGIRVGDTLQSAKDRLSDWGYETVEPMIYDCAYRKHDVLIELVVNGSREISLILVAVDRTNEENVEF